MRAFFHLLLRILFRFRAFNTDVLNTPGPVLLIPNHVSWIDWLFLAVLLDKDWKFVVSSTAAQTSWLHRKVMLNERTFPVDTASPYAIKRMAEYLQKGGRLVLFAEGRLSRTGSLMKIFDGTGFLLFKTHAKVITCYLRGAQRVPFSPHPGWRKLFTPVTAHFSTVITPPTLEHLSTGQARKQMTNWLRDQIINQQFAVEMEFGAQNVLSAIVETARQRPRHLVLEDATSQELTYRRLLTGAEVLGRQLGKILSPRGVGLDNPGLGDLDDFIIHAGGQAGIVPPGFAMVPKESPARIGVLLPNVNATPVVILALWSLGKVPAILNFSTGPATMLACAQLAGLKQIITSRAFLEKTKLKVESLVEAGVELIYLEDVRARITGGQKMSALLRIALSPESVLRHPQPAAAAAVVLFTSGSEGVPKGVELSHRNILANIRQMLAMTDLQDTDRIFNCLPLFHSFGLTVGTLLPLVRGMYVFVYPSPLHYRVVPAVFYDRDCTIFISTNTFLNGYARKAHPYDFRSMRYMFAAAEKLQEATANTWSQKYGVRIFEGYGATECAPCVSLNTPLMPKYGSVGRLMPGMEYKLEPVEGVGESQKDEGEKIPAEGAATPAAAPSPQPPPMPTGRLFVRGPNVMKGYLNADANATFQALGGWYDTGDIVSVDAESYLYIRGRMKRFAKVSGEMVSLTAVEDALAGAFPQYGLRCQVVVVTRPDTDKGEMLVAVTNEPKLQMNEIRDAIKAKGLTNLCVPREIKVVKEIPKLGTGKVNLQELQKMI